MWFKKKIKTDPRIDELLAGVDLAGKDLFTLEERPVHYLLATVRGSDANEVQKRLESLFGAIHDKGGVVMSTILPFVLAVVRYPGTIQDGDQKLVNMVNAVQNVLGNDVKLIFGTLNALSGVLELAGWSTYNVVLPDMEGRFKALVSAPYGSVLRIS